MIEPNSIGQEGFMWGHRWGLFLVGVFLLLVVFELVRRGHLKERYALVWLAAAALSFVVGLFPQGVARLANALNFQYLTLFYAGSFLFLLLLVLTFTVAISRLSERSRELAQEVALLRAELNAVRPPDA